MRKSMSTCLVVVICISTVILLINYTSNPVFDAVTSTYNTYVSQHPSMHTNSSSTLPFPEDSPSKDLILANTAEATLTSVFIPTTTYPPTFPHLRALCQNTTFTPGLYLHCHSSGGPFSNAVHGGLSNAYNRYSTCIRLALDSGSNIQLAPLMQRDNNALWNTNWRQVGPETMIDVGGLVETIAEICPGMRVRGCPEGSCDDPDGGDFDKVIRAPAHDHREPNWQTGEFKTLLDTAIAEGSNGTLSRSSISPNLTVKVEFGDSFLAWNYTAAAERSLKAEIFRLLNFSPSLLSLGQAVQSAARVAAEGRNIVGIHFRGENDWPSEVLNASAQIDFYYKELEGWNRFRFGKWKLRDVYLSCGDQRMVEMVREMFKLLGWRVHDKRSLLDNDEGLGTLETIEGLNFDQKAVVEYVNLKGADRFLGLLPSTLSYLVAYERTLDQVFDAPVVQLGAPMGDAEMTNKKPKSAGKGRKWDMTSTKPQPRIGWFEKYILEGSWRGEGLRKHWPKPIHMCGDEKTKLLVVDNQSELSDSFP